MLWISDKLSPELVVVWRCHCKSNGAQSPAYNSSTSLSDSESGKTTSRLCSVVGALAEHHRVHIACNLATEEEVQQLLQLARVGAWKTDISLQRATSRLKILQILVLVTQLLSGYLLGAPC
eukprot:6043151-Amphidinium_carterae.1